MTIANDATERHFNIVSSSLKAAKNAKDFDGPTSSARRLHRVFDLDHVYCDLERRIASNIAKLPELSFHALNLVTPVTFPVQIKR